MNYEDVPVAVLGASGFIGRWVALKLTRQGARLFLFVRNRDFAEKVFDQYNIRGELIVHDLQGEEWIETYVKLRPVVCFNLAGYGVDRNERDEETASSINSDLPARITQVIHKARLSSHDRQNIVHCGSALEYGETGGNLSENADPRPTTLYGKTKLNGTKALMDCCERYEINGVTARLFTVYGPGEHSGRLLPDLIQAAHTENPLQLTAGLQSRDFTYIEDVAEGLLRLGLCRPLRGEPVNLATGKLNPVRHFAERAASILGIPPERLLFGAIPVRSEEMRHSNVSIDRLRELTGWAPATSIEEGVRKTIDFQKEAGS